MSELYTSYGSLKLTQFSQEWILDRPGLCFISHKLLQQYHFERVLFKLDSLERERTIISMNTNQTFVYLGQRQLLGVVDGASGPERHVFIHR